MVRKALVNVFNGLSDNEITQFVSDKSRGDYPAGLFVLYNYRQFPTPLAWVLTLRWKAHLFEYGTRGTSGLRVPQGRFPS